MKFEMSRACGTYGEKGTAYKVLVWKPESRKPLEYLGCGGRVMLLLLLKK
jgi:hypothetical protein